MTELNLNLSSVRLDTPAAEQKPNRRPWKKGIIAFLLSLLFPGMGQLYNRRPVRGVLMALSLPACLLLAVPTRVFLHFWSMVSFFAVTFLWRMTIPIDAARSAMRDANDRPFASYPKWALGVAAAIILIPTLLPTENQFFHIFPYFRAYKASSASMCPTICEGERFVADATAFAKRAPARGDVILMHYQTEPALFIKRVVGVGGDIVAPGKRNSLTVNGNPVKWPSICGEPGPRPETEPSSIPFVPVRVAENALFVVGDNLNNSFDSRIEGFGPVRTDQVRGRPLYIYWSAINSRIACPIR